MTLTSTNGAAGSFSHRSVLLDSAVDLLLTDSGGRYVDATFGRGGHSRMILERLAENGALLGIDKDPQAIDEARALAAADSRFNAFHGSFADLSQALEQTHWPQVEGVLMDLGVSSPQLDDASRGFSFMRQGPLDMRMNPQQSPSAAEWLASADEKVIADVIFKYGEERFSRRIARLIVERRAEAPITTTLELAELAAKAVPKKEKHKHPATRTFQAIRIFINRELEDLELGLKAAAEKLAPGGRLVVISFHSLEDRLVKRFMRDLARGPQMPKGIPVTAAEESSAYRLIGKASKAAPDEVSDNVRARSAVMRVLERRADIAQENI
ncbi:16S rRNA (cytosine(1402)-N(4))-methyltransferase RsmH [Marinobacter sp. M3C]|uniref:16S rRNA (cytosine(1402)-N(4))-methyltransferase RsmH n=1 Tax=unclassified Marinobacter TaxID=83889 RepID=UPI00200CF7B8|nr:MULTISPECIES: 16S rRNA (cytosine(1402)-N(4))-methyltransferase RsmH [unclassified Marinobacter]MCL1477005.1 16S rRNA (cytosine(1402)-N(4))-methyltransferase RsmH [Marinobacter sp.]MCL1482857.1 16S rRNA (cytosine(1402)-N(4))-methyltransferase RsmH [Marinobacter sp.]MCL1486306.1 16S rRNA (cytosine(1402)-N(4))-methyltransferase RsmH [Marinobacter sp.]MCL1488461.1 16S rRNA (cytosine(1402)-N(4))-methyltransferase RsmH [Marinobacter sp.]UQG56898.1 16S rRNA (cytosine(1402)-N(4))-methyltransferase 